MPYLIRVDDVGWKPDKSPDRNLDYFRQWRNAFGCHGWPVVYGVIPACLTDADATILSETLLGDEEVAIHGWDHAAGAEPGVPEMITARYNLDRHLGNMGLRPPLAYIAPFNRYSIQTVRDWQLAGGEFFLGGFPGDDHQLGELPALVKTGDTTCLHLSCRRDLYDRAANLHDIVGGPLALRQDVLVLTLHVTWDSQQMRGLRQLKAALEGKVCGLDLALDQARKRVLSIDSLTAPHYLATAWVLDRIRPGERVFDFGSRYSILPSQLVLRGCNVTAFDRDKEVVDYQLAAADRHGLLLKRDSLEVLQGDHIPPGMDGQFDTVTSLWAAQHNLADGAIERLAVRLGSLLKPGGKLLLVGSFTPGESREQHDRADPQVIMNWIDHKRRVIEPSSCRIEQTLFFAYGNGTAGRFCDAHDSEANAVCYHLVKE